MFPPGKKDYVKKIKTKNKDILHICDRAIEEKSSNLIIYKKGEKIVDIRNKKSKRMFETYSITKTFCALAVLFLIHDKKIKTLKDPVSKYIDVFKYGNKKDILIVHILTHTSGLETYWDFFEFMGLKYLVNVDDIAISISKTGENNKKWIYNDTATQIIPLLVKRVAKKNIYDYLKEKLFDPLDMKVEWNRDDYGNYYAPNGMSVSADDLAKVGLLLLNKGKWENKQLISNDILKLLYKKFVKKDKMKTDKNYSHNGDYYGLLTWGYDNGYGAMGYLGQYLTVIPSKKIVAVRLIEPLWKKKSFTKRVMDGGIYFNDFNDLLGKIKID